MNGTKRYIGNRRRDIFVKSMYKNRKPTDFVKSTRSLDLVNGRRKNLVDATDKANFAITGQNY